MRKFLASSLITATFAVATMPAANAAGAASLNFSAKSGSYAKGSSFTLNIVENSGAETINVVEANFLFEEATVQLVGKSCNTAVFGVTAPGQGHGLTCGSYAPVSGPQVVGSVTFKAIADGAVSIGFAHTSRIWESTNGTDIWNQDMSYSNLSFYTPVAQPAVKKTAVAAAPVVETPVAEAPKEEVKAEQTVTPEAISEQTTVVENDSMSVWAYLAVFLGTSAVTAGIVYRGDNLKKWANNLRGSMLKTAPVAAVATASAGKPKTAAVKKSTPAKKKTSAKKKPATRNK